MAKSTASPCRPDDTLADAAGEPEISGAIEFETPRIRFSCDYSNVPAIPKRYIYTSVTEIYGIRFAVYGFGSIETEPAASKPMRELSSKNDGKS
jgi:hypothetical protein